MQPLMTRIHTLSIALFFHFLAHCDTMHFHYVCTTTIQNHSESLKGDMISIGNFFLEVLSIRFGTIPDGKCQ